MSNSINPQHLRDLLQIQYDGMLERSNNAFQYASEVGENGTLKYGWLCKSEAYDTEADLLAGMARMLQIPINQKVSDRQLDIDLQRQEECAADAELDITERHYHEA
ncbi:hypothetical protein ACLOAU_14410 [Niabella sp. CJ426]|uniref:hypothetical protein n=1 Tax=Niabella sp. CJ426 TaxID=3393740 RepID=UPI003CFD003D